MSKIKAFLHPTMLRAERSFKRLMKDFNGGVGYGVAIMLIEILSSEEEQKIPITDMDLLADEIGISMPILNTIISKYNIFIVMDDCISCPLLDKWLHPFKKKVEQNRKAGRISAQKKKEKAKQQELQLLQDLSASNSTQQMLNKCITNKIKQNKTKEIKNTTTSSSSLKNFEEWLEEKSKNTKNPPAYKATLLQKYQKGEKSVLYEFANWQKQKERQKEIEKLIFFRNKKIMLEEGKIYEILGVEHKEDGLHVYIDNPYQNGQQILFSSIEEIEKRIQK